VTEAVDIEGLRITLVDTAGIRHASDGVEAEGVERARRAQATSDVTLVVLDGSAPLGEDDHRIVAEARGCRLLVKSKSDLASAWTDERAISVSAATLEGVPRLKTAIARALDVDSRADLPAITNLRHITLVRRAREAMVRARDAAGNGRSLPEEFVLADLQEAKAALEEISGRRTSEDLLAHIFSQFCIGK
jgi:tRNA modification GTPase